MYLLVAIIEVFLELLLLKRRSIDLNSLANHKLNPDEIWKQMGFTVRKESFLVPEDETLLVEEKC